jgi:UDP-N-acetyl-2-amino-2-deoxyglucuronate dehydrogenase
MIKIMIIGAGGIAPAHIEGYLTFKDRAKIVAIADRSKKRAEDVVEKYDLDAKVVEDFKLMLDEVDAVSICTPPGTHRDIATYCLNNKKHVLLEKPMAVCLNDCDAIIEAAQANNCFVSVVAQSRFISSIANTIKLIHSGDYGKVLYTYVNSLWWRGQSYYDLAWRGKWETEGGGCTLNHAVHHIDLLIWAKGMPTEIISVMNNLGHDNSEEEDLSVSILKYADGTMAQLTCSLVHHGEEQKLNFQMEKAGISIPFEVKANVSRPNGFPVEDEKTKEKVIRDFNALEDLKHEHHTGQVQNFLSAIVDGEKLLMDGVSGRNTIELITAVYKSACTGKKVTLPLDKNDVFYTHEGLVKNAIYFNEKTRSIEAFEDTTITSFKGKF